MAEVLKINCSRERLEMLLVSFSCIFVSQNSVATQLMRDGLFHNPFNNNCPQNAPVEEF